ncbi:hypothetical protein ACFZCP_22915 [Streptomyces sp. NPDC007971]|uniref:hypothetical protein n=1 Tax=Streptomyces sp. NPDC007971 TaxID=3364799 RepID=UPI0036E4C7A0
MTSWLRLTLRFVRPPLVRPLFVGPPFVRLLLVQPLFLRLVFARPLPARLLRPPPLLRLLLVRLLLLRLLLVRLLLVLATAAPVYGTAPAYGAEAAPPDSPAPAARPVGSASPAAPAPASATAPVPASAAALLSASPPSRPPEPSRAGSRAGEGRIRPGRPDGPDHEEEGDDDTVPATRDPADPDPDALYPQEPETADVPFGTPTASAPPREAGLDPARPALRPPDRNTVRQGEGPAEPTLQILPLGSGLVLIGLGLGLALLGLRVRRS